MQECLSQPLPDPFLRPTLRGDNAGIAQAPGLLQCLYNLLWTNDFGLEED
jgi:hypothetical protein